MELALGSQNPSMQEPSAQECGRLSHTSPIPARGTHVPSAGNDDAPVRQKSDDAQLSSHTGAMR